MPAAQMVMGLRSEKCAKNAHFCLCNLLIINEKKVKRLKTDNTDNFIYFWGVGGPEAARCRAVTPSLRTMSNIGSDLVGVLGPLLVLLLIVISLTRRKKKPRQRDDEVERPHHWWPVVTYLGGKYSEITIDGHRAVYCFQYFPVGKFEDSISEKDLNNREEILKFKEGDYSLMAQLLSDFINGNFRRDRIASWVLCAIPASTIQKHRLRYSALLKTVSEETGIRNGIDFIRPKYDRKDSRQQKEANTIRNLEFDRQQIHGNWIILIDDVTTRGTSFVQCVNKLYACGAKYVCGFFMGKTVDL